MHFRYSILYVDNVSDTLAFYSKAFGFQTGFQHESGDYGELLTGDTKLCFSAKSLMRSLGKTPADADPKQPTFELAFETDDVPAALERAVKAGATLVMKANDMEWGQTISYVTDPNGFMIEICSPLAD